MRLRAFLFFFVLFFLNAEAANRFWVANAGTYSGNITDINHWSTTSGGAGGSAVPTNADDVFFDGVGATGGDKTITLNGSQSWRSFDMTGGGAAGIIISHSAAVTITVGQSGSTGVKFEAGGTYTAVNASTSAWALTVTASVTKNFTSAGYTFGAITINASGTAFWQLADTLTVSTLTHSGGTFSTNAQTVNATVSFLSNNASTRTLTITNSTINLSANSGTPINMTTTTGLTLNASGSVINVNGSGNRTVALGSTPITFGTVNITGAGTISTVVAGATFANFNHTSPAGTVLATNNMAGSITVTGTLTLAGNSAIERLGVINSPTGTPITITAAAVALSNVDFVGVLGAGAAAPFTGTSLGNGTANTGITFTPAVTRYWVGNGGNFSSTAHWAPSSGGTPGSTVPLLQDNAIWDENSNSLAAQTFQFDLLRYGNLDFSALVTNPALIRFTQNSFMYGNFAYYTVFLSLAFDNVISLTWANQGTTATMTPNGFGSGGGGDGTATVVNAPGGTLKSLGDWTKHSSMTLTAGTLDANNFLMEIRSGFTSVGALTRVLNMGTGIWWMGHGNSTNATLWTVSGSGITINPSTSTIKIDCNCAGTSTFAGGGFTYGNFEWAHTDVSGNSLTLTGANTFANFIADPNAGGTLTLPASTTTTASLFAINGTAANHTSLVSNSSGTAATISVASGNQISNYVDIKDSTATGGANFYARGSVNTSGNTGWNFGDVPGAGMFLLAK